MENTSRDLFNKLSLDKLMDDIELEKKYLNFVKDMKLRIGNFLDFEKTLNKNIQIYNKGSIISSNLNKKENNKNSLNIINKSNLNSKKFIELSKNELKNNIEEKFSRTSSIKDYNNNNFNNINGKFLITSISKKIITNNNFKFIKLNNNLKKNSNSFTNLNYLNNSEKIFSKSKTLHETISNNVRNNSLKIIDDKINLIKNRFSNSISNFKKNNLKISNFKYINKKKINNSNFYYKNNLNSQKNLKNLSFEFNKEYKEIKRFSSHKQFSESPLENNEFSLNNSKTKSLTRKENNFVVNNPNNFSEKNIEIIHPKNRKNLKIKCEFEEKKSTLITDININNKNKIEIINNYKKNIKIPKTERDNIINEMYEINTTKSYGSNKFNNILSSPYEETSNFSTYKKDIKNNPSEKYINLNSDISKNTFSPYYKTYTKKDRNFCSKSAFSNMNDRLGIFQKTMSQINFQNSITKKEVDLNWCDPTFKIKRNYLLNNLENFAKKTDKEGILLPKYDYRPKEFVKSNNRNQDKKVYLLEKNKADIINHIDLVLKIKDDNYYKYSDIFQNKYNTYSQQTDMPENNFRKNRYRPKKNTYKIDTKTSEIKDVFDSMCLVKKRIKKILDTNIIK